MPGYAFSLGISGFDPAAVDVAVALEFSDGQTASATESISSGSANPFLGPITLTGSENLWITITQENTSGYPVGVNTIGPYLVSEVGLLP